MHDRSRSPFHRDDDTSGPRTAEEQDVRSWHVPWALWPRWLKGAFVVAMGLIMTGGCRASMGDVSSEDDMLTLRVMGLVAGGLILTVGAWQGRWYTSRLARREPPVRRPWLLLSRTADAFAIALATAAFAAAGLLIVLAMVE